MITKLNSTLGKILLFLAVAVTMPLAAITPAFAGVSQPTVVSANPADWTPNINDGAVYKVIQVGSTVYAGGLFTSVTKGSTVSRQNLVAFDATTGALKPLSVTMNGQVWTLASDGTSLYVGGAFSTFNGTSRRGLVKINPTTGAVDTSFNASLSGNVYDAAITGGRLIIAGSFAKHLQAVNSATGADTGYINLGISGTTASNAGSVDVYRITVNPAGTRLVGVGNFTTVAGVSRPRVLMATLGTTSASLNAWNYPPLNNMCAAASLPAYMRDADFSPDGSYFILVSTGYIPLTGQVGTALCDATARFETDVTSPSQPTWINYTGGDTLHSGVATGSAVYVQGHQRWLNNPQGNNSAGPGAVSRPGIGAIDPVTGLALSWNPTKGRGVGGKDILSTSSGIWVASDTAPIGGETHARIAYFPL